MSFREYSHTYREPDRFGCLKASISRYLRRFRALAG